MKQPKVSYKCKKSNSGKRSSKQMKKSKQTKTLTAAKHVDGYKRHAFPKKMYLCCGLSFRLRHRLNLSPVSNKRLQSSAYIFVLGKKRTQCINACAFRIPFQLHTQMTMAFLYNMPFMARISFYRLSSQK